MKNKEKENSSKSNQPKGAQKGRKGKTMFMKTINTKAVGNGNDKNMQGRLWAFRKAAKTEKTYLTLRREPNNEYDANSIAIIGHANGKHYKLGYVPAKIAFWLAAKMDAGEKVRCYQQKDAEGNKKPYVVGGGNAKLGLRFAFVRETIDAAAAETEAAVETETETKTEA